MIKNISKKEIINVFSKLRNDEDGAIEELYEKCQKLVVKISFSIVKNIDIAEEVTQMVFLKIIQMPKEKLPVSGEISWIYSVTKNQALDYLRSEKHLVNIDEIYNITENSDEIGKIIDIDSYNSIIDSIDGIDKEIISLKIISNYTFREIGELLKIPVGTVQWKYYKDVNTLKLLLSNFSLFIIISIFYLHIKSRENENAIIQYFNKDNIQSNFDSANEKNTIKNYGNNINSAGSMQHFSNTLQIRDGLLFGGATLFFILTLIFGIAFVKRQRKLHKKKQNDGKIAENK